MGDGEISTTQIGDDRIVTASNPNTPAVGGVDETITITGTAATVTIEINPEAQVVGSKRLSSIGNEEAGKLALREALAILTDGSQF